MPSNKPKNSFCSRSVIGPRLPSPTGILSTERTGVISAAVPVRNTSSAMYKQLARNVLLEHGDAGRLREPHDRVARDARQDRRGDGRRVELAVLDQEQVLAGAFADEPRRVQREPLGEAEAARLERHERARQVVAAGLGEGRDRVRRDALPRRDADVDALLEAAFAEIRAPFPGRDRHARGLIDVAGHAHLAVAAKRDRPDVGAAEQAVLAHDVAARGDQRVERERNLDAIDLRRVIEAPNVVRQPKARGTGRRLVDANAFEYRRAVVQRMTQHVHRGLLPRHQLAFVPNVLARLEGHLPLLALRSTDVEPRAYSCSQLMRPRSSLPTFSMPWSRSSCIKRL